MLQSFKALLSPPLSCANASHRKAVDLDFDKANAPALAAAIPNKSITPPNTHPDIVHTDTELPNYFLCIPIWNSRRK